MKNGDDIELNSKKSVALHKKFGDMIEVTPSFEIIDDTTKTVIYAMLLIICVFSILFSLIVTHIVNASFTAFIYFASGRIRRVNVQSLRRNVPAVRYRKKDETVRAVSS